MSQWPLSPFSPLLQQVKQLQPAITLGPIALIHGIPTEFWSIFCSYLADILPRNSVKSGICPFSADNLHLADFQHFFSKVSANIWKERSIWQTFGIRFLFFFRILGQISEKNLTKISRKSAEKSKNRNSDSPVANV